MTSGFCPDHGPFDGATCPYCGRAGQGGGRQMPPNPRPLDLDDDDLPTDLPGYGAFDNYDDDDESETVPPRSGRRILDETVLPRRHHDDDDDKTRLEEVRTGLLGLLWIKEGNRRGKTYDIRHGTIVGRREGNVRVDDDLVSKQHAKFTIEEDKFVIWDLGTSNGTFVNGTKIRAATPLSENDEIKIGSIVFVLKTLGP